MFVTVACDVGCLLCCLLIAVKAVDALMETQWANPKEGDDAFFASRADVVEFLDRYICLCSLLMFCVMLRIAFCYDSSNTNITNFVYCYCVNIMGYVKSFKLNCAKLISIE
jgi:hypothetical protein